MVQDVPLSEGLNLSAEPEWQHQEILAVVALVYAKHARHQFSLKTSEGTTLAAMAYADAIKSFSEWEHVRGLARCRNPWELMANVQDILDRKNAIPFIKKEKTVAAKHAAATRHAADPRQEIKHKIFEEWKRQRAIGRVNASKFASEMERKHDGKFSAGAIKNMQTAWNKEFHPAR
jgi:hypothetical protein